MPWQRKTLKFSEELKKLENGLAIALYWLEMGHKTNFEGKFLELMRED